MYLIKQDFESIISLDNLDRLTNSNDRVWQAAEKVALEEMKSYMRHRYDVAYEFRGIVLHDGALSYLEGDRVYIDDGSVTTFYVALQDVPTNTLITDDIFWKEGDDRNQKLINICTIILLYENYTRLNGNDIPNWLAVRYDGNDPLQKGGAIGYLKNIQKGVVSLDLRLLEDVESGDTQSGNRIAYGSAEDVKNRNFSI